LIVTWFYKHLDNAMRYYGLILGIVSISAVFPVGPTLLAQFPGPVGQPVDPLFYGPSFYDPSFYESNYRGGYWPPVGPVDPRYQAYGAYGYRAPRSTLIQSEVVAAPPLPPANLLLSHRRNETLRVEIYDSKKRQTIFRGDIPTGQSVQVTLPRDAGGYVNETYQSVGPYGDVVQRNVTRVLPVTVRYEVTVHQWQVQSIAIDRTGKSPSPIEDIQYQGKGLGRFALPAGKLLTDGQIDVYRAASAARNQGAVAPLQPPTENDGPTSDPLLQAIQELNRR